MFWIIGAILIVIALAFLLPALRKSDEQKDASREQNIFIAQEQLAELEQRFERGEIDQQDYQLSRDELELSLFSDIGDISENGTSTSQSKRSLLSAALILLLIPAITVPVYLKSGNLNYINAVDSRQALSVSRDKNIPKKADGTPDIEQMVAGLQKRMEQNPDDAKGWYMLGRSYMVLNRYPDAVKAFSKAYKQSPESADAMLSLADALSMTNQGQLIGRPADLIKKALVIRPDDPTALWLSGMAERQQGNNAAAITQWNKLLPLLSNQPQQRLEVESLISQARRELSPSDIADVDENTKANETNATTISVSVTLAEKLKSSVSENDFVFVYAKALNGPPMPLAAVKKQVKDLPLKIVLNDELAMMPDLNLSSFKEFRVGARVSKSGSPIGQNGDLFTEQENIKAESNVELEIDSILSK